LYRGALKRGEASYAKGVIERGGARRVFVVALNSDHFKLTGFIINLLFIFNIIIIGSFLSIVELCGYVLYYLYILRM
jgi:hypothetical protein